MKLQFKREKFTWQEALLLAVLAAMVCYAIYCIFYHLNPYGIDSDTVNAVLYRRLSGEQKNLFPAGYVCSHESLTTHPVLIYWLYYGITHNFLLAYQLECSTVLIIGLIAFYWLLTEMRLSPVAKVLGLCLFALYSTGNDTSFNVFWFYNDAYSMFVIITIVALALQIRLYKAVRDERNLLSKPIFVPVILSWILAAVAGFGSPRLALVIYLPIFLTYAWSIFQNFVNNRKTDYIAFTLSAVTLIALSINGLSYIIFTELHGDFFVPLETRIASPSEWLTWDILAAHIRAILYMCGLSWGGDLKSFFGLRYLARIFFLFIACVSCIQSLKKKEQWPVGVMAISLLLIFAFEVLQAVPDDSARLFFPVTLLIPISCAIALDRWALLRQSRIMVFPYVVVLLCTCGIFTVNVYSEESRCKQEPSALISVANYMEVNGYQYVTASYWNAGAIAGYTNGRVVSQHSGNIRELTPQIWLIDTNLFQDEQYGVPNILLLTDEEEEIILNENNSVTYLLKNCAEKVQEIAEYNLYALNENPFTLVKKIKERYSAGLPSEETDYKMDYPDGIGFYNRNSSYNDARELVSDGTGTCILWGPYSQSVQGTYDITLHYAVDSYTDNDSGTFDVALNAEQQAAVEFFAGEQSATIYGVTLEGDAAFEARVYVPEGMIVRIQSIEYQRVGS